MIKTAKQRLSEFLKITEDQCEADCFVAALSEFKSQEISDLRAVLQLQTSLPPAPEGVE